MSVTRFTYPVAFKRRADAEAHLPYFGPIGALIIERGSKRGTRFTVAVDTDRPDAIRRWLDRQLPDVPWEISEREDWLDEPAS